MNPIKSIKERQKGYVIRNFSKSKYAKKLKKFQNIHQGETCFIIGNGPSLKAEDLEMIYQKGIPTFAFNRIYLMFDKTQWRPTYYISQDEKTLKNCTKEVNQMDLPYKFIPLYHKYYHDICIDHAFYFNLIGGYDGKRYHFPIDISNGFEMSTTVAYTAAQFAVYMGFTKIYFIGVDHNFSIYQNEKGEIITDDTVRDYFSAEYNNDKQDLYIPRLERSEKTYIEIQRFCKENKIEVYNATRGGKLEVFPRVDFDEVINNI